MRDVMSTELRRMKWSLKWKKVTTN